MKLAQGEYVALEKIENILSPNPIIAQIYVHGEPLQSYLLAVVVLEPIKFAGIASRILGRGVSSQDDQALADAIKDDRINAYVLSELTKDGKKYGLKGSVSRSSSFQFYLTQCRFEMIKRVYLTLEPFSLVNGTLTPTLKIKRKDAANLYKAELEALYALGDPSETKNSFKL